MIQHEEWIVCIFSYLGNVDDVMQVLKSQVSKRTINQRATSMNTFVSGNAQWEGDRGKGTAKSEPGQSS